MATDPPSDGKTLRCIRDFCTTHWSVVLAADEHDRATTRKRGGGQTVISLDEENAEDRYRLERPDELSPEKLFERKWAQTILEQALCRLRVEFAAEGKADTYEVMKAFEPDEQNTLSYVEAAVRLDVRESAAKSMIHSLRQRHRELVREESHIRSPLWPRSTRNCGT